MGNSNSATLHPSGRQSHHQWAHSYPRDTQYRSPSQQPQVKVLPERIPGQRLRVTDNGAILHNGGTISGRRQSIGKNGQYYRDEDDEASERVYRSRSSSHHRPPHPDVGLNKLSSKRFGSEPDLRQPAPHNHSDSPAKQRISRGRKKYRAPPPPPEGDSRGPDSSSPDSYHWDNLDQPARRLRLFKTREETKKAPGGQRQLPTRDEENQANNGIHHARSITIQDSNWGDLVRNIPDHARNVVDHSINAADLARSAPDPVADRVEHARNVQDIRIHAGDTREPSRNGLDHIRINVLDYPKTATEHNIKIVIPEHGRNVKGNHNVGKLRRGSREEKTSIDSLSVIPRVNGIRHQPLPHPHPHSPTPVHRSLSTPEFQMELMKAAQRLSPAAALVSRTDLNGRYDMREDHRRGRGEFEEREFRESVRREEDRRGRVEFGEREFRESVRREEDRRGRGDFVERELRDEAIRREEDRRGRGRGEFGERDFRESVRRDEDRRGRGEFDDREFRDEALRREGDQRGRGEHGEREFREEAIRREEDIKRDLSRAIVSRRGRFESGGKENIREDKIRENVRTGRGESRERESLSGEGRKGRESLSGEGRKGRESLSGDGRKGREKSKEIEHESDRRGDAKSDSSGRRESRGKGSDWRRRKENGREREPRKENGRRSRDRSRDGETRGVLSGPLELRLQGDGSGRESSPAPTSAYKKTEPQREARKDRRKPPEKQWEIITPNVQRPLERDVPTKTFYFGMEQGERDAVERFAASIHRVPLTHTPSGSGGSLCSEVEEEIDGTGSIALQLRPTLPKKQLEIPRFSPTSAWRLLSALETPAPINICEEVPVIQEERILRSSRPMAPLPPQQQQQQQHAPRSHDKSGDSGISGDASPGGLHEDSSEAPLASPPMRKTLSPPPHDRPLLAAWTPQQDLGEEESSSDGDVDDSLIPGALVAQPKFSPRAQVFSLSLPRDNRLGLALYSDSAKNNKRDSQPSFNSLKKLKRSVSGALNALGTTAKGKEDDKVLDENWLLSRSVPNSLTSGHVKPNHSRTSSPSSPDLDRPQRSSFSYLASGGHVMYLPDSKGRQDAPDRLHPSAGLRNVGMMSKSCENISTSEMRELDRTPSPDAMIGQERVGRSNDKGRKDSPTGKRGKNRRFTFQSTVRQIERRRISERLSRDAELKERRRLGELEAMRRVEEEFQRKRAPEKANIRQQLRLFNLDEQLFSSLPNGWADSARAEPDGAASSSPNSSTRAPNGRISPDPASLPANRDTCTPQTQILSEYREPRRDYREYRPARFSELGPDLLPEKRATVHPPAVFDMPKSSQVYVAAHRQAAGSPAVDVDPALRSSSLDNYRKDFAHGAMRSLASSDSELSQPNTRPHSRQQSRSVSPSAGRRSVSEPDLSSEEDHNPDSQQVSVTATNHINLTTVQPFSLSSKGYRPIAFTLGTKPPPTDAQFVN